MIEVVKKIFQGRKPDMIGHFRKSAVMLLLTEENGETYLIFEVRALSLRSQPGDIALPGGKIEVGETPKEAAFRETIEELNVSCDDLEYIGSMDYLISPYYSIMYPFVAKLKECKFEPNASEVDHIIKIPLSFFMETEPLLYELPVEPVLKEDFPYHLIRGGRNYKFSKGKMNEYFYQYNQYVIWGFTASIVKRFTDIVKTGDSG